MDKIGYNMIFDTNDVDFKTVTEKGGGYVQIDGIHSAPVYFETPYISKDFDFTQILRVYDKKQERRDNVGEIVNVEEWVRWELELTGKKAMLVAYKISSGKLFNSIIKGILSAHYCFKTKPKNPSDLNNKDRLSNMRWWDKFIGEIEKIPLNVKREKMTLQKKKKWVEENTSKSISMIYEVFESMYGKEYAELYLKELIENVKKKINVSDETLIAQRILELMNEEEY